MMQEATRALFSTWRAEIEEEIAGAKRELATVNQESAAIASAAAAETARIGDIDATLFRFGAKYDLAKPLYARLVAAKRIVPEATRHGLEGRREALHLHLADLHKAPVQIEALLAPPRLRLIDETPRLSAAPIDDFDPIIMPARSA